MNISVIKDFAGPVAEALWLNLQYMPAGRLAIGTVQTILGGYSLYKSELISALWNRVWRRDRGTELSVQKITLASFALINLYFGLSSVRATILEGLDTATIEEIKRKILQCPPSKNLFEQVMAEGKVDFQLEDPRKLNGMAFWSVSKRKIILARAGSLSKKVAYAIFELCNAKHATPKLTKIYAQAVQGNLPLREFVKEIVTAEYPAAVCQHEIATRAIKSCQWERLTDLFAPQFAGANPLWRSVESMWEDYATSKIYKSHWMNYVRNWNEYYRAIFCAKHPFASEC